MIGGDITRRVITRYEAITDPQEKALEKLKGKTEESGKGFVEWAKSANESFNSTVEGLGKVGLAFEGLKKITEFGKESFKAYADSLRLTASAGSADLERLSEAANGLKNEHELLTFAAQAQHGTFKLSQQQMELSQQAMLRLTRAGFENEKVTKAVTDAVVALKDDGLKDLGIHVRTSTTDAEKFSNIMAALAQKANAADTATESAGESVQKIGVRWQDAMEGLKKSVGELIVALAPLIDMIAKSVGYIAKTASLTAYKNGQGLGFDALNALSFGEMSRSVENRWIREMQAPVIDISQSTLDRRERGEAEPDGGEDFLSSMLGAPNQLLRYGSGHLADTATSVLAERLGKMKKAYDDAREKAKQMAEARKKLADEIAKTTTDDLVKQLEDEVDTGPVGQLGGWGAVMNGGAGVPTDITHAMVMRAGTGADAKGYQQYESTRASSFLEQNFGKIEEINAYKEAFSALSGSVGAAYSALVDGNMSAGDAVKSFIRESLKALGQHLLIRGLQETAEGIASLAIGGPIGGASAGAHFAAAGAFAAAAGAAGLAASAISVPGGSSSSSAGGGAGAGAASASGGGGGVDRIIVYDNPFSDASPRTRLARAKRMVAQATGSGSRMRDG